MEKASENVLSAFEQHQTLNKLLMGNLVEVPEQYFAMYGLEAEGVVADLMLKDVETKAKEGEVVLPDEMAMLKSLCEENGVRFEDMEQTSADEWVASNGGLRVKRTRKMAFFEDVSRNLVAAVKTLFECTISSLQAYTVIVNHSIITLVELVIPKEEEIEAERARRETGQGADISASASPSVT